MINDSMTKKAALVSLVIALGGVYAAGLGLGFSLNLLLEEQTPGVSATGQSQVGLPWIPNPALATVWELRDDINNAAGTPSGSCSPSTDCALVSISRFVQSTDVFQSYTGGPADGGPANRYVIDGVEGQRIQVRQRVNYIITGSHDPGRIVNLDGPGTNDSATGQTELSFPYHGVAVDAAELRDELNLASESGDAVRAISRFIKSDDSLQTYSGSYANLNFLLTPGESYRIQVSEDVAYIPSHY